ncbi:94_t:CDS:1, partial [Racocetra fulgida]
EDGKIDSKYPLQETPTPRYEQRTEWNVRDAEATLIILPAPNFVTELDGTAFTVEMAKKYEKPWQKICLDQFPMDNIEQILVWIEKNKIKHLNVAGPRESNSPGIQKSTYKLVYSLLEKMANIQLIKAIL